MKKYLVIGNPIEHSLSPELHNYWIKTNMIKAIYEKMKITNDQIKDLILEIKGGKINGLNITVPFKQEVIPHLDHLSEEAHKTQSVNTVLLKDDKVIGHNTDIEGFEYSIKSNKIDLKNKNIFIMGAGGVVSSIIYALTKMQVSNITISNRTKSKAENLKKIFEKLKVIDWGEIPEFDMIINATSIGLNNQEKINLDLPKVENKFFYDVIYNPKETNFLKFGKQNGNKVFNGKMMFIYQAFFAFKLWHNKEPEINNDVLNLLDQ
jgi:shikimate dehydrogenase